MYLIRGCAQTQPMKSPRWRTPIVICFAANCLLHRLSTEWDITVASDACCQHRTRRHINFSVCCSPASFTKELEVTYSSLNAIVAQSKNYPFGVNTTIEQKQQQKWHLAGCVPTNKYSDIVGCNRYNF